VSRYILRRVVMMIPLIFGISVIMFAVIRFAPGDPAELLADPEQLTTEQLEAVRANLGLDRPFHIQYVRMMTSLASGDLLSFRTRQPVLTMIAERLPTTLTLTVLGMTFGFTFGIAIGVIQALRPYSKLDDAGTFLSLFGFAVPNFWLGLMLIMIFAERLSWLPASGIRPGGATGWNPLEIWPYLILPTIVL
jgi:peptide/nickel transport system permease protein